jgi:hypothetical protein
MDSNVARPETIEVPGRTAPCSSLYPQFIFAAVLNFNRHVDPVQRIFV